MFLNYCAALFKLKISMFEFWEFTRSIDVGSCFYDCDTLTMNAAVLCGAWPHDHWQTENRDPLL